MLHCRTRIPRDCLHNNVFNHIGVVGIDSAGTAVRLGDRITIGGDVGSVRTVG